MSEPGLDAIRRHYLPDMLGARDDRRRNCVCQRGGVDAVSIDGDWLHVAGEHFAALLTEVESQRLLISRLDHAGNVLADEVERLEAENENLREADLRSRAEQHALAVDVVHVAADCPVCRYALGLAEPTSAAVGPWTGPVAANRPRDGWMRHTEAGDVADATTTIEPDVSGFEDQS